MHKNETNQPLTPQTRINSKWIRDLYIIQETIIILEENIGRKISDIAHRNFLLGYLSRQEKQKKKNKQMGLHQTKKFLHSKGNHQQNKKTTHKMEEHIH